jgi:hypothetical protein
MLLNIGMQIEGCNIFMSVLGVRFRQPGLSEMERMKVCVAGMGALDIRGFQKKDEIKVLMTGNTSTFV